MLLSELIKVVAAGETLKIHDMDSLDEVSYNESTEDIPALPHGDNWDAWIVVGIYSDYNNSKSDTYIRVNVKYIGD